MITSQIEHPKVVSRGEWLAARKELLVKEKQLTRNATRLIASGASYRGSRWRKICFPRSPGAAEPGRPL